MNAEDRERLKATAQAKLRAAGTDDVWHVYPEDDLREHVTDCAGKCSCWCKPELLLEENGTIVVHNSMDGREAFETGARKPS